MKQFTSFISSTLLRAGFLLSILLTACGAKATPPAVPTQSTAPSEVVLYTDPTQPTERRVEDLLARMTLDEKIGQMTQVDKNAIKPGDITKYCIGSILSGGGQTPEENTVQAWYAMVAGFQKEALATRLKIPIIYGSDAIHGHGNLRNATIFPQNIGLGAANNPDLTQKIGRATAEEMLATGIPWNFAPPLAVVQDIRWGRTYEGYSEETGLVTSLGTAYIKGLQTLTDEDPSAPGQSILVLPSPKAFLGDGATTWGTSGDAPYHPDHTYHIDRGDMQVSEEVLRKLVLPPYESAVEAGALNVMAAYNTWNGKELHGDQYLLTGMLKEELGFDGFIVSDYLGMDQVYPDDYYKSIVTSINAGVDMNMGPRDYVVFIDTVKKAVKNGDISEARLDEAVRRILRAKFALGLFEHPLPDKKYQATVRSKEHLELARQAVRESLVLLKNENEVLPLSKDTPVIFVAGAGTSDIGRMCGGWTLDWQGRIGNDNEGTTILEGIKAAVGADTRVEFQPGGYFGNIRDSAGKPLVADVGIVVLAEEPYAEGVGDRADLSLSLTESMLVTEMRERSKTLIVILLSGRPRVITEQLPLADAWVAAWLPGTEGGGIADVLFGDFPFTGKLPYSWPRSNDQLPININNIGDKIGCEAPLFPFGYGLAYGEPSPEILKCNSSWE